MEDKDLDNKRYYCSSPAEENLLFEGLKYYFSKPYNYINPNLSNFHLIGLFDRLGYGLTITKILAKCY